MSTYRMDSYENIWEALFLCHQLFRAVSGEVAERLHYAYPEYDRNITNIPGTCIKNTLVKPAAWIAHMPLI